MGAFEVSDQVMGMEGQGWSWWGSDCCTCWGPWLSHSSSWESVVHVSGRMGFLILNSGLCWLTHLATSSAGQEWPPTSPRPWLPCLHWEERSRTYTLRADWKERELEKCTGHDPTSNGPSDKSLFSPREGCWGSGYPTFVAPFPTLKEPSEWRGGKRFPLLTDTW